MFDKQNKFARTFGVLNFAIAAGVFGLTGIISSPVAFGFTLEEVVVTARKREESIQEVPIAITAVPSEVLESFGTTDILDVQKYAPGLQIDRGGSGAGGTISMRGIGTSAINVGFSPTVTVVVDGIQVERPRILSMGLMDLDQVEVLRGPQSLFFGKNSPAGAISLKTASPTDEFEGSFTTNYETEAEEIKVLASISGPLTDSIKGRLALSYRDMEGDFINTAANVPFGAADFPGALVGEPAPTLRGEEIGGEEEFVGRIVLEYAPDDGNFDARLGVSYSDQTNDGVARAGQVVHCEGSSQPNQDVNSDDIADFIDTTADCEADNRVTSVGNDPALLVNWPGAESEPYQDIEQGLISLTMNYAIDDLTLTAVTGYYDSTSGYIEEFSYTRFGTFYVSEEEEYDAFSQELRLASAYDGPLNFMFGLYYQDSTLSYEAIPKVAPFGPDPTNGGSFFTFHSQGETEGETISAFLELQYEFDDQWSISGGARWTEETKESYVRHIHSHVATGAICDLGVAALCPPPTGLRFTNDQTENQLNPEVTLSYAHSENLNLFASYRTGFKSGGVSLTGDSFGYIATVDGTQGGTPLTGTALDEYNRTYVNTKVFSPEEIEGYEAGFKYSNDAGFTLNGTAYYYEYTDLQVESFDPVSVSFDVSNAAEATIQGVELDANYATENLLIYGALSYSDAEYDSYPGASCYATQTVAEGCIGGTQDLAGSRLARAPEWTANIGFSWSVLVGEHSLVFTGNARYNDESIAIDNQDPNGTQDSYSIIDAGVRLPFMLRDREASVALYGRNLTDERYFTTVSDTPGAVPGTIHGTVSRGRQLVLEFTSKF